MIIKILLNTPNWVYILFFFLLYLGIKNCYETSSHVAGVIILPTAFLIWSLTYFFSKISFNFVALSAWLIGVFLGSFLGWLLVRNHSVRIEKEKRRLHIPGSPFILIITLIFFSFRYYVGVTIAIHPEQLQNTNFIVLVLGISSFALGILIGRTSNYLYRFKTKS